MENNLTLPVIAVGSTLLVRQYATDEAPPFLFERVVQVSVSFVRTEQNTYIRATGHADNPHFSNWYQAIIPGDRDIAMANAANQTWANEQHRQFLIGLAKSGNFRDMNPQELLTASQGVVKAEELMKERLGIK